MTKDKKQSSKEVGKSPRLPGLKGLELAIISCPDYTLPDQELLTIVCSIENFPSYKNPNPGLPNLMIKFLIWQIVKTQTSWKTIHHVGEG